MHKFALVLTSLACAGHTQRAQYSHEQLESKPDAEHQGASEAFLKSSSPQSTAEVNSKVLAGLFLAFQPAASRLLTSGGHHRMGRPAFVRNAAQLALPRSTYMAEGSMMSSMQPPQDYDEAVAQGRELREIGEYDRAIRVFESAKRLPGDGRDMERANQNFGSIGDIGGYAPNPQGWKEVRFATEEQKVLIQYEVALCWYGAGDTRRAVELLNEFCAQIEDPVNFINEMIVDPELADIQEDLVQMRAEFKVAKAKGGDFFAGFDNPFFDGAKEALGNIKFPSFKFQFGDK